ncbi:Ww domain-containing oxidoreductase [Globisporangium polare]
MSSYIDKQQPSASKAQPQQQHHDVPENWDAAQIPSLHGKVVIVTGGSSGIGLETALELACKGAHVVVACPTRLRSRDGEERIRVAVQAAASATSDARGSVEYMKLDLSDLARVKAFARKFIKTHSRLDILVNNAGIMGIAYDLTVDGIERQFATNYLGHFALTHYLLGILQRTDGVSRIVHLSSLSHRFVQLDRDNVMSTHENYLAMVVYAKSKLCNLTFAVELDRRLKAQGIESVVSVSCHPGYANTNIMGPPSVASNWFGRAFWSFWSFSPFSQSAAMGALPSLYSATASGVQGGELYGPSSAFFSMWGHPTREEPAEHATCVKAAASLWTQSEQLTKLSFDFKASGSPLLRAASS